jgi:hypothetical protein
MFVRLRALLPRERPLATFKFLASRDARKNQVVTAIVFDAVGDAGRGRENGARSDCPILEAFTQKKPLSFKNNPHVVSGMNMGMDVLARLQTPESGAGMSAFSQNYFAGLFITEVNLVTVIKSFDVHFILQ